MTKTRQRIKFLAITKLSHGAYAYKNKDDWSPPEWRHTSLDSYNHVDSRPHWFKMCKPSQFREISIQESKVTFK